jgi:uncharacterized membrane protein YidH (DUF202 family)
MSFREKSAWIALLAYAVVSGAYVLTLWRGGDASFGRSYTLGPVMFALVMMAIISGALTTIIALLNPKEANEPADERERLIDLKSERIASYTLSVCVVCLIGALVIGWDGVLVANLLLAALAVSGLAKTVAQIAHFRAGA